MLNNLRESLKPTLEKIGKTFASTGLSPNTFTVIGLGFAFVSAIIYGINIIAGFAGADYSFSHGETFVIWILMAILVNNCFNK